MDESVRRALETDLVVDITTTGKVTRSPRCKEIWLPGVDGRLYITGIPGPRSWFANLVANPEFTLHLKRSVKADLRARATPVLDETIRRELFGKMRSRFEGRSSINLEDWVRRSPLVLIEIMGS